MTNRTHASLSLDLDNLWSYMRIHGDPGWQDFPSYLDVVVPRFLTLLRQKGLAVTVFIVGKDATIADNNGALLSIPNAGHEVGNHSHMHEPWLHRYSATQIDDEIGSAHEAISAVTGVAPVGFRGPGFSLTPAVLDSLLRRGYRYDSTSLPTFIGPLARWYYFRGTDLDAAQTEERAALFGAFADGFKPNRPHRWQLDEGSLMELPVTTFPVIKVPFHFSYLLYVSGRSSGLADAYWSAGLNMCRAFGLGPTMLLHPLDFLDASDAPQLEFFPGMDIDVDTKLRRVGAYLDRVIDSFEIVPVGQLAATLEVSSRFRTPR